ncbi:MAG TPA: hypothetical protein VKK81_14180 [Candidatus Binatia bacterium]|nr:hypothetical protein [Candidatus Binatia bacterium]
MSEPKTIAQKAEEIVPGVWRWAVHDDRIDFESDAHAVVEGGRVVLIDPLIRTRRCGKCFSGARSDKERRGSFLFAYRQSRSRR